MDVACAITILLLLFTSSTCDFNVDKYLCNVDEVECVDNKNEHLKISLTYETVVWRRHQICSDETFLAVCVCLNKSIKLIVTTLKNCNLIKFDEIIEEYTNPVGPPTVDVTWPGGIETTVEIETTEKLEKTTKLSPDPEETTNEVKVSDDPEMTPNNPEDPGIIITSENPSGEDQINNCPISRLRDIWFLIFISFLVLFIFSLLCNCFLFTLIRKCRVSNKNY